MAVVADGGGGAGGWEGKAERKFSRPKPSETKLITSVPCGAPKASAGLERAGVIGVPVAVNCCVNEITSDAVIPSGVHGSSLGQTALKLKSSIPKSLPVNAKFSVTVLSYYIFISAGKWRKFI